jgi:hypothetical protein
VPRALILSWALAAAIIVGTLLAVEHGVLAIDQTKEVKVRRSN